MTHAPVARLVSAALVSEARAHEHVFVNASTKAVDVRRHLAPGLHDGQDYVQSFCTISRLVPPDVAGIVYDSSSDKADMESEK